MAMLILNNDLTNAHHVHDYDLDRLVNDCLVTVAQQNEGASIFECRRGNGTEPDHVFHIHTAAFSHGLDVMKDAVKRSRGDRYRKDTA